MGLDIYAGTYTRYCARNWKTKTRQLCEEYGIKYSLTTSYEVPEDMESLAEQIELDVNIWMEQLIRNLKHANIDKAVTWQENNVKEYYTDKPDWDALGALLFMASSKALKEEIPIECPKGMDYFGNEIVKKATEMFFDKWALFQGVFYYIPIEDTFFFQYPLVNGETVAIGTVEELKQELCAINKLCWDASEDTIMKWHTTEGYPSDSYIGAEGNYQQIQVHEAYNTDSLAKFAFAVLWKAVTFAEKERVMIIFDY